MNILSKKMMLFGIAFFLTQNVCAMDSSLLGKDILYIDEAYLQELEDLQRVQELEDKASGPMESRYSRNLPNSPEASRKKVKKTLDRTSRKTRGTENNTPPSNTK